jgi:hypothetical protein
MISPTGFGERTMSASEPRRKALSLPLWSQAFYDLVASRASIRFFLQTSFVGKIPEELVEFAYNTSHRPGARYAPLYFLSGQLFTEGVRAQVYGRVRIPVLVIYDKDGYTDFDHLHGFLAEHPTWAEARIDGTRGMPQWDRLAETAESLNYFWAENV